MLSSCINWVHTSVRNVKSVRRYCRNNDNKNGATIHALKLLKAKQLDDRASESDDNYYSDIDYDIRDMLNNVVLNPEEDPEIMYFRSFCKTLLFFYPLTLN